MHLCEGRPFVIMISGIVELDGEEGKVEGVVDSFEEVVSEIKKEHELKFHDKTGALFEVQYGLISVCSKSFIAISPNPNGISFIFTTIDLLYPFYEANIIENDVQKTKEFVVALFTNLFSIMTCFIPSLLLL